MGTFLGHLLPATTAVLLGLWWLFSIARRYNTTINFHSSSWFPSSRFPTIAVEPVILVLIFTLAAIKDIQDGFEDGYYDWTNVQHTAMYTGAIMVHITQLLQWYKKWVPTDFDYIFMLCGNFITGYLLSNHLHGRPLVDVMLHKQIILTISAQFFSTLLELFHRGWVAFATARAMSTVLFGINLIHTGFILFPPWNVGLMENNTTGSLLDLNSHASMVKINIIFVFEICFCSALALFMFGISYSYYSKDTTRTNKGVYQKVWIRGKDTIYDKLESCCEGNHYSEPMSNGSGMPNRSMNSCVHRENKMTI